MKPSIAENVFIASSADIIADVSIGKNSSVWFQCVIRGDVFSVSIGERTNIQDGTIIHVTADKYKTVIGNGITIGHQAVIHGATLKDNSFIGMSATVLDNAVVHEFGFVAAGALVAPGFEVPEKTLVAGVPAKIIRPLKPAELEMIKNSAVNYQKNAETYNKALKAYDS